MKKNICGNHKKASSFLHTSMCITLAIMFIFSIISLSFIPLAIAKNDKIADIPAATKDNPSVENKADIPAATKDNPSVAVKISKNLVSVEIDKSIQDNVESAMECNLGDITKENHVSVKTKVKEKTKTVVRQVDFNPSQNQKNVKLHVSNLVHKPDEIDHEMKIQDKSKVYQYLDIKLTADDEYIGESGISTMMFTFTVEKTWIKNHSMDKYTIKMMRYHNDTWQELNTSYMNETEDMLYYTAMTPGLSVFAVVGTEVIEESDAIVEESISLPWWASLGFILSSSCLLGVVLFKKRFIYTA